jgi:hypothetical protein
MAISMGGSDFRPGFDERREVWRLLHHLTTEDRLKFLQWCCDQVSTTHVKTKITENDGSIDAVYWDLNLLAYDRGLSLDRIGTSLVKAVKRFGVRPGTKDRRVGVRAGG